jgi:fermentation-respiration switch protein FrsA (DUF1100 family)
MAAKRHRLGCAAAGAAFAAALAVIGWSLERHFLYFPTRVLASSPAEHGLSAEDLDLRAEDGVRLRGWRLRGEGRRALLYFHGNAGNVADRLDRSRILVQRLGLDVFLVDYRGYGLSEGEPSEEGLYRDARTVYGAARERGFEAARIVFFGESLGSAVAVDLATRVDAAAVVLETPFLSIAEMARVHYPFVPAFLIRSRYDNGAKIGRVAAQKLFLVAERDEVAPPEQGRRLYELAQPPKTLYVIPRAAHNDTYVVGGEEYWRKWEALLASLKGSS